MCGSAAVACNSRSFSRKSLEVGGKVERSTIVGKPGWVCLASIHVAVCAAAAFFASFRAFALVCLVSILAMIRYCCMALAARNLGNAGLAGPVAVSGWIAALVALAAVLFVMGRHDGRLLAWPVAAALAGPAVATVAAAVRGLSALRGASGHPPAGDREAHSGEVDA